MIGHELLVVGLGCALLVAGLISPRVTIRSLAWAAKVGLLLILGLSLLGLLGRANPACHPPGMFSQDGFALVFKRVFVLIGLIVTAWIPVIGIAAKPAGKAAPVLILFSVAGMCLAASANNMVGAILAAELVAMSAYVLPGAFARTHLTVEATTKYLVLNGLATACSVFGLAMVWGATGSVDYTVLSGMTGDGITRQLVLGLVLFASALAFKLGAMPFQFWVPDVYQGLPTPVTMVLAAGSKLTGFVLLARLFFTAVPWALSQAHQLLAAVAIGTVIYGTLGAIPQQDYRRFIGYSGIANAGLIILGLAVAGAVPSRATEALTAATYFAVAYAFSVLAALTAAALYLPLNPEPGIHTGGIDTRPAGSGWAVVISGLGLVSMAGIPPTAGFFGKFLILKEAIGSLGVTPIMQAATAVAALSVVASVYYYLKWLRVLILANRAGSERATCLGPALLLAVLIVGGAIVLGGLFHGAVCEWVLKPVSTLSASGPYPGHD